MNSGHTAAQRTQLQATYTAQGTCLGTLPAGANGLKAYLTAERQDAQILVTKEGGAPLS